jgi:hypothetical protein
MGDSIVGTRVDLGEVAIAAEGKVHSASVGSLAKPSPSHIRCARVVAVYMSLRVQLGLDNPLESHPAVATPISIPMPFRDGL